MILLLNIPGPSGLAAGREAINTAENSEIVLQVI